MRFIRTRICPADSAGTGTSRNSILPGEVITACFMIVPP